MEDEDKDDVQLPLVREDIVGGVVDCAAAVTRERVEPVTPMTGRKVNRRRSRYARMSCSHCSTVLPATSLMTMSTSVRRRRVRRGVGRPDIVI